MSNFSFLILFSLCVAGFSQQYIVDSLKLKLNTYGDDSNKVKTLQDISYYYTSIQPDSAMLYANKTLELAEKIDWEKGIGWGYKALGTANDIKAN